MSKRIFIRSLSGDMLNSIELEYCDRMDGWKRDLLSLVDEIDGLTTWIASEMVDEYIWDTEWMCTRKRSPIQRKVLSKVRATLDGMLEMMESNSGVICVDDFQ